MTIPSKTQKYFENVAGNWNELRSGFFREEVRKVAIQKAYLRPEYVVVDMGAGTGFLSEALAPLVRKVFLIDASEGMLQQAQKNLSQFTNLEYRVADGTHIPLPDESVDAVFANMYLHHCPQPLTAIKEMVRILRPGGRLTLTDLDEHPYSWLKEEMADTWQGFERKQVFRWFEKADLVNIFIDGTGECCCAKSKEQKEDEKAKISIFLATGTRRVQGTRSNVRKHYHALAVNNNTCCDNSPSSCDCNSDAPASSCCSGYDTPEVAFTTDYPLNDVKPLPKEAAQLSLGCGNPIQSAALQPGEVVLDIGSGAGLDCLLAARKVGETGFVYGVDMTPVMVEKSQANAKKAGISHIEFKLGHAENLPLNDASVNVIISNCVINLCEDKGRVFNEAFRVLRPGGRMVISDMVTDRSLPLEARKQVASWASCVAGALPEQEYLDLIQQAGFLKPTTQKGISGGMLGDVEVYSLEVIARKP
jgi:ubiquinone/menaquinone biosynthesis C-methylase UbiE